MLCRLVLVCCEKNAVRVGWNGSIKQVGSKKDESAGAKDHIYSCKPTIGFILGFTGVIWPLYPATTKENKIFESRGCHGEITACPRKTLKCINP